MFIWPSSQVANTSHSEFIEASEIADISQVFLERMSAIPELLKNKIDNGMVSGFGVISIGLIGMAMVFNGSQPLAKQWIGIVQGYIQLFSCFLWANTSMSYEDVGDKCFCITCYVEVCLDGGQQILLSLAPPAYTAGT